MRQPKLLMSGHLRGRAGSGGVQYGNNDGEEGSMRQRKLGNA